MSLEVYFLARDGAKKLSANFAVREFACRDGSDPVFVDTELVALLQAIRDYFGRPVILNSAYRTPAHNKAVGGRFYSQHQYGRAADIHLDGVSTDTLADYAETLLPGRGGIGRYRQKGFVHVDVRRTKWRG